MRAIQEVTRVVYRSPTAGRSFLTKRAAIHAEANAIIKSKYPSERSENDEQGRCTSPGWYWRDLPNSDKLFRRVVRLIKAQS